MADGEVSVGFLADKLGESQPKVSRHLAYLRTAGLASTRRDGKWIYYGIEKQADVDVSRVLDATLRSITGNEAASGVTPDAYFADDAYRPGEDDTALPEYSDDWAPAEMEIYLL